MLNLPGSNKSIMFTRDGQDLSDNLQGFLSGLAASSFIPPLSPLAA
jgi:hypothetical protein